jgi:hypothetical protein
MREKSECDITGGQFVKTRRTTEVYVDFVCVALRVPAGAPHAFTFLVFLRLPGSPLL